MSGSPVMGTTTILRKYVVADTSMWKNLCSCSRASLYTILLSGMCVMLGGLGAGAVWLHTTGDGAVTLQ